MSASYALWIINNPWQISLQFFHLFMTKLLTWSRRNRTGSVLSGDFLAASQNCFWDAYLDGWIHKWGCCIKFKASYSYKLIQERTLIIFVGNTVKTCLPIHWTDHEEAVPELLGDVGQISGFRADHAPVINQAGLGVNIKKTLGKFPFTPSGLTKPCAYER